MSDFLPDPCMAISASLNSLAHYKCRGVLGNLEGSSLVGSI